MVAILVSVAALWPGAQCCLAGSRVSHRDLAQSYCVRTALDCLLDPGVKPIEDPSSLLKAEGVLEGCPADPRGPCSTSSLSSGLSVSLLAAADRPADLTAGGPRGSGRAPSVGDDFFVNLAAGTM